MIYEGIVSARVHKTTNEKGILEEFYIKIDIYSNILVLTSNNKYELYKGYFDKETDKYILNEMTGYGSYWNPTSKYINMGYTETYEFEIVSYDRIVTKIIPKNDTNKVIDTIVFLEDLLQVIEDNDIVTSKIKTFLEYLK